MKRYIPLILISISVFSCRPTRGPVNGSRDDQKFEAVFVQVNDVYEIAPLSGGKYGGMARVASLKKEYLAKNKNTFMVMAGDFLSPSVYNSLKYNGERIRGKQMVEAMNAAGMDLAVFGNHEFDITEKELLNRINESKFDWVSSNSFHKVGGKVEPFAQLSSGSIKPFPEEYVMDLKDDDGTSVKIGFIGLTLPFNKADYVSYTDPFAAAEKVFASLKSKCDAVVALTHQNLEDDIALAKRLPGLAVILGGHEHDRRFEKIGSVYITKAHANARSAYVVTLKINKKKNKVSVMPVLREIDESIALDSSTNIVVQKWIDIAEKNYASLGFNARNVVKASGETLDGRESEVRNHTTNLSKLIGEAIAAASPRSDVVLFNTGSVRIDDFIAPPITEYDIIRALPFGGGLREVDMKGSLLIQALDAGRKNKGVGGFLINYPMEYSETNNTWLLNKKAIDPVALYKVVMPDFLLTGGETNLGFLNTKNPEIVKVYDAITTVTDPRSDVRLAIVQYLKKQQ